VATKAIIFDLGGIIFNIDYDAVARAFKELGAAKFDEVFSQDAQADLMDRLEEGKITPDQFRGEMKELLQLNVTDQQFDVAWHKVLLDIPKERLDFVYQLRQKGYKTFLYSNTNEIHFPHILKSYEEYVGLDYFNSCFDKQYYSHIFGKRKPHVDSFLAVAKEIEVDNNIKAYEILFIDDTIRHIKGAEKAGLKTLLMKSNQEIENFRKLIDEAIMNFS
jgi:glucose-1-phosphatase